MNHANPLTRFIALPLAAVLFAPITTMGQSESESQRQMARQMAQWMDTAWNRQPDSGMSNIRLLMRHGGSPFAGKISVHTEFSFRAIARRTTTQGFNPNGNGRWVFEGLEPGDYQLHVSGSGRFSGFSWTQAVTLEAGDRPVFEIEVPG
jgi:hypothetical protein